MNNNRIQTFLYSDLDRISKEWIQKKKGKKLKLASNIIKSAIYGKKIRDDFLKKEKAALKIQSLIYAKEIRLYAYLWKKWTNKILTVNIIKSAIKGKEDRILIKKNLKDKQIKSANIIKKYLFKRKFLIEEKIKSIRLFH